MMAAADVATNEIVVDHSQAADWNAHAAVDGPLQDRSSQAVEHDCDLELLVHGYQGSRLHLCCHPTVAVVGGPQVRVNSGEPECQKLVAVARPERKDPGFLGFSKEVSPTLELDTTIGRPLELCRERCPFH